jgi:hypothetical protein
MDGFYPLGFFILFFALLYSSLKNGEETSHNDEDIDDYWSDG